MKHLKYLILSLLILITLSSWAIDLDKDKIDLNSENPKKMISMLQEHFNKVFINYSYPLDLIAGFGNGAEFYAPSAALGMGSKPGYKHHIHNGYVSLLFRMGIVGLVIFLLFAYVELKTMRRTVMSVRSGAGGLKAEVAVIPTTLFAYFILTLVEFLTIYVFIGDIKWGVLLGIFRVSMERFSDSTDGQQ